MIDEDGFNLPTLQEIKKTVGDNLPEKLDDAWREIIELRAKLSQREQQYVDALDMPVSLGQVEKHEAILYAELRNKYSNEDTPISVDNYEYRG